MPDYELYRGDLFLGTLTETDLDMPWWGGRFDAATGFETVRGLFDRELALGKADRMDEWSSVWAELARGLRLVPLDGRKPIDEFLIHIEGSQAWWRIKYPSQTDTIDSSAGNS